MVGNKNEDLDISSLEVLVPRGLLSNPMAALGAEVTNEGLCPIRISWEKNSITKLESLDVLPTNQSKILLPRLVEPHAHLDKAFTWQNFPNLKGTYHGAIMANFDEHKFRSAQTVRTNAEKALKIALKRGLRAIRTHVDSYGPFSNATWDCLVDLKKEWHELIYLQFVAMVPLNYWSTKEGENFAKRVANVNGLFGAVLLPPLNVKATRDSLFNLFKLANQFGCGVDLHIDESSLYPAEGLKQLIHVLDHIDVEVPITCSHLSSMSLLQRRSLEFWSDRLADHEINVIALPLTNSWLLEHKERSTPLQRPIAPIAQLQKSGVNVAVGGDNVQDPWFPGGSFDPISLMSFSMPIAQLAPWNRLGLAPFTTASSRLMGLEWDGTFDLGSSANFMILEATNWAEAFSFPPKRDLVINGKFLDKEICNS